jgi:hypothetical protein
MKRSSNPSSANIKSPDTPDKLTEEEQRFQKRTIVEQLNGRLKDEFGSRH